MPHTNFRQADLNDASTLGAAVHGAFAVFAVTNYWESKSAQVEMKQGKAIADAAKVGSHEETFGLDNLLIISQRLLVFSISFGVPCWT